jgi:hypothetical protein
LSGETEIFGENLPQWHFVQKNFRKNLLGINTGSQGGKPATNPLSYDTAHTD